LSLQFSIHLTIEMMKDRDGEGIRKDHLISLDDVKGILTLQAHEKRMVKWELHNLATIRAVCKKWWNQTVFSLQSSEYLHTIGGRREITSDPVANIVNEFPYATEILAQGGGHIVLAGGAVLGGLLSRFDYNADADFFFHSMSVEKADRLLKTIIQIAMQQFGKGRVYVTVSTHVTTLYISKKSAHVHRIRETGKKYQFIHRVYPSKDAIIGSFDITASSFMYDGEDIYATNAGLFAISRAVIIADLGSRSASFATRLKKYHKKTRWSLIFPGAITNDEIKVQIPDLFDDTTIWLTVGEGIRIMSGTNRGIKLLMSSSRYEMGLTKDYEGGDCNDFNKLSVTNTVFVMRGQPQNIRIGFVEVEKYLQIDYYVAETMGSSRVQ
jgi:hypothetical protein